MTLPRKRSGHVIQGAVKPRGIGVGEREVIVEYGGFLIDAQRKTQSFAHLVATGVDRISLASLSSL